MELSYKGEEVPTASQYLQLASSHKAVGRLCRDATSGIDARLGNIRNGLMFIGLR